MVLSSVDKVCWALVHQAMVAMAAMEIHPEAQVPLPPLPSLQQTQDHRLRPLLQAHPPLLATLLPKLPRPTLQNLLPHPGNLLPLPVRLPLRCPRLPHLLRLLRPRRVRRR
jgi:hypothetical protein